MTALVFATNNQNKVREIDILLSGKYDIRSLQAIGCLDELPETHATIEENSAEKARYVYDHFHLNCFSEDTGMEVEALNGEPGVDSAHYSGERDADKNMDKVLAQMKGITNRSAQFKTVITLIINGEQYQFTGILKGEIGHAKKGDNGFGYDPIFVLPSGKTLAELTIKEKSDISHRGMATQKLITFLENYQ